MTPDDLAEVQTIFTAAIELPPGERAGFVAARCADRPSLHAEVESLLASHGADGVLDVPAIDAGAGLTGLRVGAFQLVREIGRGGMSIVYLGVRVDGDFTQKVAVKIVDAPLRRREVIQRFRAERQILASFAHPNIVSLLDGGVTADGHAYLVMELVDGEPLTHYCAERRLTLEARLVLLRDVCAAVQYAHQHGVVHRDLKPANILVTAGSVVKVLDFGVAKLLDDAPGAPANATLTAGLRPLTPNYASPEQLRGLPVTTAADIYALGVLTYEVVAGVRPYDISAETLDVILKTVTDLDPRRPSVAAAAVETLPYDARRLRGDLDAIVLKTMSKDPVGRYGSAQQLADDLARYGRSEPVDARPPSVGYVLATLARRHRAAFAAASVSLVALVVALSVSIWQTRRAERRFQDVRMAAHSLLFDVYDSVSALPGSVAARQLVVSRAQQYLDGLAREAGDDRGLTRELAESYLRLGDVLGRPYTPNLGDTAGALGNYQKGLALLEREVSRYPDDEGLQRMLSQASMDVAVIFMRQGNAERSMTSASRAISGAEVLTNRHPRDPVLNESLAHAYMRLGQAQDVAAGQSGSIAGEEQVLATYRKGLSVLESAGPFTESFWQARLASMYFYVAYPLLKLGERTGNVEYFKEALDSELQGNTIKQRLAAANPENVAYARNLADGLGEIGLTRWRCCRDLAGALRDEQAARAGFERILDRDAQNREARRDVANAYQNLGLILGEAAQHAAALNANHKALVIYEDLDRADPTNDESHRQVSVVRARIAALERAAAK
jgi:serine/threonine protein kinase/tetratricopeptide (TPR) repeat protein